MAFPGFLADPIDSDPLDVEPCPGHLGMVWREGGAGELQGEVEGAAIVVRADAGGTADGRLGFAEGCESVVEVELQWPTVWSVVLVDSVDAAVCPDEVGVGLAVGGGRHRMFLGEAGGGVLALHANVRTDPDAAAVVGTARSAPLAPAGAGGECLFTAFYITSRAATGGELVVTPILDGEVLTDEAAAIPLLGGGTRSALARYEIPLSRAYEVGGVEVARTGLRGTWIQALLELKDCMGCGGAGIEEIEAEFDVVRETLPEGSFSGPAVQVPMSVSRKRWFMGESGGGRLLQGDQGADDGGAAIEAEARSIGIAPAGAGGECLFTQLYFTLLRANAEDLTLRFTPLVDDVELEPIDVVVAGTADPILEPYEISLAQPYVLDGVELSRYHPRGAWCAVKVETVGALPDDRVELEEIELEFEVVRESLEPTEAASGA